MSNTVSKDMLKAIKQLDDALEEIIRETVRGGSGGMSCSELAEFISSNVDDENLEEFLAWFEED